MNSRRQNFYARGFSRLVTAVRTLRPHRWPIVGRMLGALAEEFMRRAHPGLVSVNGHEMRLDARDDLGLARGRGYERQLQGVMERYVHEGATVIEGGAHIGYHTLNAARLVGPDGRVISFEPAPATFALLTANLERNGYGNVTLINGALSDRSGSGCLHLSSENTGDHRIANGGSDRDALRVNVYSLDEFLEDGERVDFVKLDIQGAEPLVLRGATKMLDANPQLKLVVEFAPFVLPPSIPPDTFLEEIFRRFARVYDVCEETQSVVPTSVKTLLTAYTRLNGRFTNLLCAND